MKLHRNAYKVPTLIPGTTKVVIADKSEYAKNKRKCLKIEALYVRIEQPDGGFRFGFEAEGRFYNFVDMAIVPA